MPACHPPILLGSLAFLLTLSADDLPAIFNDISLLPSPQKKDALHQIYPDILGTFDILNITMMSLVHSILSREPRSCYEHLGSPYAGCRPKLWAQPFGYFADHNGKKKGFEATGVGGIVGVGFCLPHGIFTGIAGGYGSNSGDWHDYPGALSLNSSFITFYIHWTEEIGFLQFSTIGSWDEFSSCRHLHFADIDRKAKSSTYGGNTSACLRGGASLPASCGMFLQPFGTITYFYLRENSYHEQGALSLDLNVKARGSQSIRSELGINITKSFGFGKKGCFAPLIWVAGINDFFIDQTPFEATFSGDATPFLLHDFHKPVYLFCTGTNLNLVLNPHFSITTQYWVELNREVLTQKLDGRLAYSF